MTVKAIFERWMLPFFDFHFIMLLCLVVNSKKPSEHTEKIEEGVTVCEVPEGQEKTTFHDLVGGKPV